MHAFKSHLRAVTPPLKHRHLRNTVILYSVIEKKKTYDFPVLLLVYPNEYFLGKKKPCSDIYHSSMCKLLTDTRTEILENSRIHSTQLTAEFTILLSQSYDGS